MKIKILPARPKHLTQIKRSRVRLPCGTKCGFSVSQCAFRVLLSHIDPISLVGLFFVTELKYIMSKGGLSSSQVLDRIPRAGGLSGGRFSAESIRYSEPIMSGLMALSDGVIIALSGLGIYLIHPGWDSARNSSYITVIIFTSIVAVAIFLYDSLFMVDNSRPLRQRIGKVLRVYTLFFLALIAFTFALKVSDSFSRIWVFSWFLGSASLLILARVSAHIAVFEWSKSGRLTRNLAIVGANEQSRRLLESLGNNGSPWIRVAGIFDDRAGRIPETIGDCPVIGNLERLVQEAREKRIDDVLVALPWGAEKRLLEVLKLLKVLPVRVSLCPDMVGFNFPNHSYSFWGGIPVLDVFQRPIDGWSSILKSLEDRILGSIILLISLPVMLIIAVLIKLDSPGSIFFRQTRYGFNNQPFEMLKFRSLYVENEDNSAETLVTRNDPRVTRVGAFLRRTSLDELPQILNVLQGHMSLVGPRPHAKSAKAAGKYYYKVVNQYHTRHKVKPGITGWAQINGWRGETDTEEKILKRVEYDIYYIENWSVSFDIVIILRTILSLIPKENAY